MFKRVQEINLDLNLLSIDDDSFQKYGSCIKLNLDFCKTYVNAIDVPTEGNRYQPCVDALRENIELKEISSNHFNGRDIQLGYCHGHNVQVGAVEFHEGCEIIVALSPCILFLGEPQFLSNKQYNTKNLQAYYIEEGQAVKLHPRTLHFSPCKVQPDGFKTIIILEKGTNEVWDSNPLEYPYLWAKDKYLLCHEEHKKFVNEGAHIGLLGENYKVNEYGRV